jgi:hypothetical protein
MSTELRRPSGDNTIGFPETYPVIPDTHFDKVNEAVADDGATFNDDILLSDVPDLFDLPATAIPAASIINSVYIFGRAMTHAPGPREFKLIFYDGVNSWGSGAFTLTRNIWNDFDTLLTTNPATGLAWTFQEIQNLLIGYYAITANVAVTQLYVQVDYTPPKSGYKSLTGVGI